MSMPVARQQRVLQGVGVSPGIVIGRARLVERSRVKIFYQYLIRDGQLAQEEDRFRQALRATEQQLERLKERIPEQLKEHAFILDSLLMILKDSMLSDATLDRIRREKINAEWALKKSLEEIRLLFSQIEDDYISQRIADVEDVSERILRNLAGKTDESLGEIDERVVIVARDLSPTDITELNTSKVMGFVTEVGGRTSHAAIMAQALQIPVVVGLETATALIQNGDLLIVEGSAGRVIVNPEDEAIIRYQEKQLQHEAFRSNIARTSHLPAETLDGHRIAVRANIEFLEEVVAAKDLGAEGVGLYRTEFLYLRSQEAPPEQALFDDYREVVELMNPEPVTIRTLDLGGDKLLADSEMAGETNPALGLRSIRICLRRPEILKTQLRAILRAGRHGRVRILLPMISGLEEVLAAREILAEVKQELKREGVAHDPEVPLGIMIEVPSAVAMADRLAKHADFFSIGTNDLIQYALAVDRINKQVAYLYEPYHPAILRMIQQVATAARSAKIGVSLCGEMAGDPLCVPVLVAMGIQELSMNPGAVPLIKKVVQVLALEDMRGILQAVMAQDTPSGVRTHLRARMKDLLPELEARGFLGAPG